MVGWLTRFGLAAALLLLGCAPGPAPQGTGGQSLRVSVAVTSFNPSRGKVAPIRVEVPWRCALRVEICDPHGLPVRKVWQGKSAGNAAIAIDWDGKDDSGGVVPDEAYYVKVMAMRGPGDTVVYDPALVSGGQTFNVQGTQVNLDNGTLSYTLDKDARIYVRAGEKKGLLVKSIVHGAPRIKGQVTEYWDGRDADGLISVRDMGAWALVVSGYTLPDNSIIAYGNGREAYRDYFRARFPREIAAMDFPNASPGFAAAVSKRENVNLHYYQPLLRDFPPKVSVEFPNAGAPNKAGMAVLRGTQRVLVNIDENDRIFNRDQQFELGFFIDGKFSAEDEIGYVPYNWIWNVTDLPEGEHVFTVNLASFRDQIGTKSIKVLVQH